MYPFRGTQSAEKKLGNFLALEENVTDTKKYLRSRWLEKKTKSSATSQVLISQR